MVKIKILEDKLKSISWEEHCNLLHSITKLESFKDDNRLTIGEQIWVSGFIQGYTESAITHLKNINNSTNFLVNPSDFKIIINNLEDNKKEEFRNLVLQAYKDKKNRA